MAKIFLGSPSKKQKQWICDKYGPLCFTAVDARATITFKKQGSIDEARIVTSTDGKTWTPYTFGITITLANVGDKVYFRAEDENNISFYADNTHYYRFATTEGKKIAASGNIQTLMKADGSKTDAPAFCYYSLFTGCKSLTTAPKLPAMTLASYCYSNMFSSCTSLTNAPELPATTLAYGCYKGMFYNCKSLTSAPALPATTLAGECYCSMFDGCSFLTATPQLPATTLAVMCYYDMFNGCTSLTSAPDLPATTLAKSCYLTMFSGCTALTSTPKLPATTLAEACYRSMFYNCTSLTGTTTVTLNQMASIPSNAFYNMFYGTTSQAQLLMVTDFSTFVSIPTMSNPNSMMIFNDASDTRLTIKVPASLLTTWKTSSNWSNFATRIVAA